MQQAVIAIKSRSSPRARKRRLKAAFLHGVMAEYASALGGQTLEMQRQNVPLQSVDL